MKRGKGERVAEHEPQHASKGAEDRCLKQQDLQPDRPARPMRSQFFDRAPSPRHCEQDRC